MISSKKYLSSKLQNKSTTPQKIFYLLFSFFISNQTISGCFRKVLSSLAVAVLTMFSTHKNLLDIIRKWGKIKYSVMKLVLISNCYMCTRNRNYGSTIIDNFIHCSMNILLHSIFMFNLKKILFFLVSMIFLDEPFAQIG